MAGRVRSEDVALVRERVRVDAVVGEVVTLRSAGAGSLKGLCPFHEERTPSFHVTPSRGLYYCFGCGEGGDVVDFLMKQDHLTFTEAIEKLANRAGVTLRYEDGGRPARSGPNRTRLVQANQAAADYFAHALGSAEAEAGRAFLSGRGFDEGARQHFGVGFAPRSWDGLLGHLRSAGFSDAESLAAGLVSQGPRGTYDRFRGRLVWPIRDASGDVLGFGARKLFDDDQGPKYLNTPETVLYKKSHVLYGIDLARRDIGRTKQVVIVEGYTDVMAAHLAGVTTAVATCGTAFGSDHAGLLRRYLMDDDTFAGEVIFTFDGDEAGQKAALKAFDGDQRFVAQTFVAISPGSMDPCELRLAEGDEAVRRLVSTRTPLFAFAIRSVVAGCDLTTAEGRVAAVRQAAPLVARIRDAALRPEYARLLSGWVGLPEAEVRAAVAAAGRSRVQTARSDSGGSRRPAQASSPVGEPHEATAPTPRPDPRDPRLQVERESLKCVLQAPELVGQWYQSVVRECFRHPRYAQVHEAVVGAGGPGSGRDGRAWIEDVLVACADDTVRAMVRELAVEPLTTSGEPTARYATSIVARLLFDEAGRRLVDLKRELGQLDQIAQAEAVAAVFADVMALEAYRRELSLVGRDDA